MCGIFGWALPDPGRREEELLVRLTNMLAHRGPDGSGVRLFDTADRTYQIGLGHRRLAIIDLSSAAAQPMDNRLHGLTITYNGEIYNYLELRDELANKGHVFSTNSDTEVLLASYAQWGTKCFTRLRGMFAFALWDSQRQIYVFARDHYGKKPLYFYQSGGQLLFSSEVQPLLAFPGVVKALNKAVLADYVFNRYVPGPATFFKNVAKLPPGSYAIWKKGRLEIERYYEPPVGNQGDRFRSYGDALAEFSAAFDESVKVRMRSDAPYGAFLSGGIDSSAVVCAMAKHSPTPVRTFAAGFSNYSYSELDTARAVARSLGTLHHELIIEPEALLKEWGEAVLHRGAPTSETADLVIALLSKEAFRSVRMVLTGEGADELLAGYPKYQVEPWLSRFRWMARGPVASSMRLISQSLPYAYSRIGVAAQAASEPDANTRMRMWFGGISPADCISLVGECPINPQDTFPFSARSGSRLRDMLFFDQTSWLPDNLLERGDRMMMIGSIEGRMPFLDVELAKIVSRMPDNYLLKDGVSKRILRDVMKPLLPKEIIGRRKIGFRVPIGSWFQTTLKDNLLDLLMSDNSRIAQLCNADVLRRFINEHLLVKRNHERVLWMLTNLEVFLRVFDLDPKES